MKKLLLVLLAIVVIGGAWSWFKGRSADDAAEQSAEPAPAARVEVAPLKHEPIARTIDSFGVIAASPSSDVAISAPFDCLVRAVHVGVGARVAAGDVLLEIEPNPDAKLALLSARSAATAAEKNLAATRQRFELKLATNQDLLTAQQGSDDARQKLASFEARGLTGDGRIKAPSAGIVSKLDLASGALVPAGTLLVSVVSADHLEARLAVEIGQLAKVKPDQRVTLTSANRPDLPAVSSTVRASGGSIDATTGTAEVRVGVPAGAPFYFGEHVRGAITVEEHEALVAPRRAVLPEGEKHVLFTVHDGKAVRHEVVVGIIAGDRIEVQAPGLHPGEAVVTLGNYELTDGMAVQSGEKPAAQPAGAKAAPGGKS